MEIRKKVEKKAACLEIDYHKKYLRSEIGFKFSEGFNFDTVCHRFFKIGRLHKGGSDSVESR